MNAAEKHFLTEAFRRAGSGVVAASAERIEVDAGMMGGERVLASMFVLSDRVTARIYLSPDRARSLMLGIAARLGERPPAPPRQPRPYVRSKQQVIAEEVADAFRRLEADPLLSISACAAQMGLSRATLTFRLRKADPLRKKSLTQTH